VQQGWTQGPGFDHPPKPYRFGAFCPVRGVIQVATASEDTPVTSPASTAACRIHGRNVSALIQSWPVTDVIGRQSRVVVTDLLADQRTALRLGLRVVSSGHHANLPNQAVSTWVWGPVGRAAPIAGTFGPAVGRLGPAKVQGLAEACVAAGRKGSNMKRVIVDHCGGP